MSYRKEKALAVGFWASVALAGIIFSLYIWGLNK
tara:strand:- start:562 stop:663 length:102 start_codon:yes stop_codon:yes gene_type:complete